MPPSPRSAPTGRRILVVAVSPVDELDLVGPLQVFHSVNRLTGRPIYRVELATNARDRTVDGEGGVLTFEAQPVSTTSPLPRCGAPIATARPSTNCAPCATRLRPCGFPRGVGGELVRALPGSEPLQTWPSWSPELGARVVEFQSRADVTIGAINRGGGQNGTALSDPRRGIRPVFAHRTRGARIRPWPKADQRSGARRPRCYFFGSVP
jgi:hypothetical protein